MYTGTERRQSSRVQRGHLKLTTSDASEPIDCPALNLSVGGVSVRLHEELRLLSQVDLQVSLDDDQLPVICRGKVNWTMGLTDVATHVLSDYTIGIEFTDISDEDQQRIHNVIRSMMTVPPA